jgi:hypothetical protein
MSELKDGFLRDLDKEKSGIFGKCKTIETIIRKLDPPVSIALTRLKVET